MTIGIDIAHRSNLLLNSTNSLYKPRLGASICEVYLPLPMRLVSVVELKFAKQVIVSRLSCSRQHIQNPHCISPFAKGEIQWGWIMGRTRFSLRLIRLWRNRQVARN